jgi:hypothetical protein
MANLITLLGTFALAVISHVFTLLAGCAVTVVINLIERYFRKKLPIWVDIAILLGFVLFACFQAWKDEYQKAQSESVYVETHVEPAFFDAQQHGHWFALGSPIDARFIWTRTGQDIAVDIVGLPMIFIEPNQSLDSQKKATDDVQGRIDKKLADNTAQHIEGATLGYSDDSRRLWGSAQSDRPVLTKALLSQLWDGSKILFYVSAVSYKTPAGQRYESHFCNYLQPLNINSVKNKGKPLPEKALDMDISISFVNCDMYNSPVKK